MADFMGNRERYPTLRPSGIVENLASVSASLAAQDENGVTGFRSPPFDIHRGYREPTQRCNDFEPLHGAGLVTVVGTVLAVEFPRLIYNSRTRIYQLPRCTN